MKLFLGILLVVFISLLGCKETNSQKEDRKNTLFSLWPLGLSGGTPSSTETATTGTETPTFKIGGVVSGLVNPGLVLQNNGSDNLSVTSNGSFTFTTYLKTGTSYSVTASTQPTEQDCTVANGTGTANADITNIAIVCTNTGKVATPNTTPIAGTYNSDQSISLSTTSSGATIYYTLNGSTPTQASLQYTGTPISVTGHGSTATIKAFAIKPEKIDSDVLTANYTINYDTVGTPSFTVTAGTYNTDQNVGISVSTAGATIYYTVDGSTPNTGSPQYIGTPISITGHGTNKTVKAMATKSGLLNSAVATGAYTIAYDTVGTPSFSITPGTYNSDQVVGISTSTVGATIYYTTNGATPSAASTEYTGTAIPVSANRTNVTIKAIAIKTGVLNSVVTTGAFTISYDTVATPSFNVAAGTYTSDQSITLSTTTVGATIYYTTDGNTPTTASTQYVGTPILISGVGSKTIKALAVKSGMLDSAVTSASYTITYPTLGGTVTGRLVGTIVLQNNGGDNKSISANGLFTFATPVTPGSAYTITILTQPSGSTCTLENGTGNANGNITNVVVYCIASQWAQSLVSVGGTSSLSELFSVATSTDGSIYVVGLLYSTVSNLGNSVTVNPGQSAIIKYDRNGNALWARNTISGSSSASFVSVATGSDGSVYAAGTFSGNSIDFGNSVTVTSTTNTIKTLLVKYDSNGNAQWARIPLIGEQSEFKSVSAGNDNSVYTVGYLDSGTYDFGNSVTINLLPGSVGGAQIGKNVLIVKYDSIGNALWAKTVASETANSYFWAVATGNDGTVYAAGWISGTATIDLGKPVNGGVNNFNALIVKYDSNGNTLWAKSTTSGANWSHFNSVSVSSDGSVYAAGYITGTGSYSFGNSISVSAVNTNTVQGNAALVKYDSNGNAVWARSTASASKGSRFNSVSVSSDGAIYAVGNIGTGTYNFGNSVTVNGSATGNISLVKYDSNGNAAWARSTTSGTSGSLFSSVATSADGFVYCAGYLQNTASLDFGNSVTANGVTNSQNILLVKYK